MTQPQRQSTIIVTGAAGFIGSHTVDQLLYRGHRVIGVDNLSTGSRNNLSRAHNSANFELHTRDLLDPGFMTGLCKQVRPDAIVHLAALVSVTRAEEEPQFNFRLNIEGTQIIAEAARLAEVPRIVFASSAAVYGNNPAMPLHENDSTEPVGHYGTAKLMSEMLLHQYSRSYGITTVCNRYFNVFGPRQDPSSPYSGVISLFTDRYARNQPVTIFGDGEQTRDFISVHDVSYANTLAALTPNIESGSYNICTGQARSLLDLIGVLQKDYGRSQSPNFDTPRGGDIKHSLGAPDKAAEAFGFRAHIDFSRAIAELNSVIRSTQTKTA